MNLDDALGDAGLMTVQEAADRLKVNYRTVLRMSRKGEYIPPIRLSGWYLRFSVAAHERWVREQVKRAAAASPKPKAPRRRKS